MKVGDVITLTKEQFLVRAKQGLVVSSRGLHFFYSPESIEIFSENLDSRKIPGYVYGHSTLKPESPILGFWSYFPGTFRVRKLPNTVLFKPRKATNDN